MGENLLSDFQLTKVRLKNILSFKDAEFSDIGQLAVFIGPNNTGKSNLFRTLQQIKFDSEVDQDFFYANVDPSDAEIMLGFTLSVGCLDKYLDLISEKYKNVGGRKQLNNLNLIAQKTTIASNPTFLFREVMSKFSAIIKFQGTSPYLADLKFDGETYENSIKGSESTKSRSSKPSHIKEGRLAELNWERFDVSSNVISWQYPKEAKFPPPRDIAYRDHLTEFAMDFVTFYYFCGLIFDFFDRITLVEENRNFQFKMDAILPEEGRVNPSGQNFPQVLFNWRNNNEAKFYELERNLKEFYPNVSELRQHIIQETEIIDDENVESHLKTKPEIQETPHLATRYFDKVGKGMHQVLILLAHLLALQPNSILLIEEPELFLHPKLQKQLIEKIIAFLPSHQILLTSHSPFILNALPLETSLFQMQKNENGASFARKLHLEEMGGLFDDLGVRPADFLVHNGIIFVEGKRDATIFKKLLGNFLNEEQLEILTYSGKRHLVLTIIQEAWERLTKNNIKLLFILDGDEGNERIVKELPPDQKTFLKTLPVREIENIFLDPSVLTPYLIQKYPNEFWDENITKNDLKITLDSFVSEEIKLKTTIKTFFDHYINDFTYSTREKFINSSSKEDFLKQFVTFLENQYGLKVIDQNDWRRLLDAASNDVEEKFTKAPWQHVPGKEIWKKLREEFTKRKTPIEEDDIIQLLPSSDTCGHFLEEVKQYFQNLEKNTSI